MNDSAYPGKPSGFVLGKEVIIVIVIVFSGMSFTLGFFVGKNSITPVWQPALQAVESSTDLSSSKASPGVILQEPVQTEPSAREPLQSAAIEPLNSRDASGSGTTSAPSKADPQVKPKEVPKAGASQKRQTSVPATAASGNRAPIDEAAAEHTEQNTCFTVQIGAFQSPADARNLKALFDKKGFKTYIVATKDTKGRMVYKVRTGEYSEKKDAEVLALKLRKTEGLNTYVTARTK